MTKKIRTTDQAKQIRLGIELARFIDREAGLRSEEGTKLQRLHGTDTMLNTPFKQAFYFTAYNIEHEK